MTTYQAVIWGVNPDNGKLTFAKLPFDVIAKDDKNKEIKDKDGNIVMITPCNYFAKMLQYQIAEMSRQSLIKYDYLFTDISVSGKKYGRIDTFGYIDKDNKFVEIGDFGTDENGNYRTAKDVFPTTAKLIKNGKKYNGTPITEMTNKVRRDFCRNVANSIVMMCNFADDVKTTFAEYNKDDKDGKK